MKNGVNLGNAFAIGEANGKNCPLKAHVHPNGFAHLCFCFETLLLSNAVI